MSENFTQKTLKKKKKPQYVQLDTTHLTFSSLITTNIFHKKPIFLKKKMRIQHPAPLGQQVKEKAGRVATPKERRPGQSIL